METNARNSGNSSNDKTIAIPQITLPKGGGAINGIGETFQPNPFSGSGSLSIPVFTSPCHGFEPHISVDYSSGAGNGIFGMGFSISLPNISRKTEKGIPRYDDSMDTFILSNAEDLVPQLDRGDTPKSVSQNGEIWNVVSYKPRIEGLFAKIEFWKSAANTYWKVVSKENITTIYGADENARISDSDNPAHVFRWLIQKTYDAKGNSIEYRYKRENKDNVVEEISEQNRVSTANKYIQSIGYGNYFDDQGQENWAFEVVFDYGEYNLNEDYLLKPGSNPYVPNDKWGARPDPFSNFKSGFEIRTHRLCRNILMFHHFEKELGQNPCLVRATHLNYLQTEQLSLLTEVSVQGFRRKPDSSYDFKSMPPLKLTYSTFNPERREFNLLKVNSGDLGIPGQISKGQYNFIDLYGEGIPGFLYSDAKTALYWQPEGGGKYGFPAPPVEFPIERDMQKEDYSLISLEGNGKLDLVVETAQRGGFYSINRDGSWELFSNFESYPLDCVNHHKEMVDIQGDGRTDLLVFEENALRFYPSLEKKGFGDPVRINDGIDDEFPKANDGYKEEIISFAGMFGDGLSHRVKVRNGCVECWPNLGYGRFGKKITFGNSPVFEETFDASRLFFADIDGSGTSDLIYVYPDRVEVFFNLGGNGFSKPLAILLPEQYSNLDQMNFADVLGNGTTCLIFSKIEPEVKHYFYDFTGNIKPYILTGTDNSLGAATSIEYASSVQFYLEDKLCSKTWKTKLPFPVQVVQTIRIVDSVSGTKMVKRYKFHDGYYDEVEREFRGFGFVEEWDTEEFDAFSQTGSLSGVSFNNTSEEFYIPPVYTKRWYHTGAYLEKDSLSCQYRAEYFQKDKQAYQMPDSTADESIDGSDGETLRQAYRSLKGQLLREEIYGLDNIKGISDNPYSVSESNFHIREVQPRNGEKYAVSYVYGKESISCHYERNSADPRIQHTFTLEVDEWGNVNKSCQVFYPRRLPENRFYEDNSVFYVYPEQTKLAATAEVATCINIVDGFWLLGIPGESRSLEINGLDLQGNRYFEYAQISKEINEALDNIINYEDEFTPTQKQARLLAWNRSLYWDEGQNSCLPLGGASSRALLHHTETAVFSPQLVDRVFSGRVTPTMLEEDGGYAWQGDLWWNKGFVQSYYKETDKKFFLPCMVENPLAGNKSNLRSKTAVEYDDYCITPLKITQYLADNLTNVVKALVDYNVMAPQQITDINDNVSQVLFDPLGMVIVTSMYGTVDGKPQGDGDLKDYSVMGGANFNDILNSPSKYLQQASSFYYYDLFAYINNRQPANFINLIRESYASDMQPGEETKIQTHISFSNGFGKEIEKKVKGEPGTAVLRETSGKLILDEAGKIVRDDVQERWLVSGRTVFNNKGKAVMQYTPFFSNLRAYEVQKDVEQLLPAPSVTHYDPLLRAVRVDKPNGIPPGGARIEYFFTRVEFSPWEEKSFDENDTVKDSRFYLDFMNNYPANPTQEQQDIKDALDKAALFYRTPAKRVFDNRGNVFLEVQNNLGEVTPGTLKEIVKGTSVSPENLFNQLVLKGYIERMDPNLPTGWVSDKFLPYTDGFVLNLDDAYKQFADSLVEVLKENCLTIHHEYDIQGHVLKSSDPRLYYSNVKKKSSSYNFQNVYNMAGKTLSVISADAGPRLSLENIYGKTVHTWDGRGFHTKTCYDSLQRPVQVDVTGDDGKGLILNQTVERIIYGEYFGQQEAEVKARNLKGQIYQHFDQAGLEVFDLYNIKGSVLQTSRQLLKDYKREPNWDTAEFILEEEAFKTSCKYDALGRIIAQTTPDNSLYKPVYNAAGQLQRVEVMFAGSSEGQLVVEDIQYNANSQRLYISYGNGVVTRYSYNDTTLRLSDIISTRPGQDEKGSPRSQTLQDLSYVYDPVGNITRVRDSTYKTVFCSQQMVEPLSQYTYDALYRLKEASGRQHPAILQDTHQYGFKQSEFMAFCPPNPNDGEKLENYTENYTYDPAGNLIKVKHCASSASWTRQSEIAADSNRTLQIIAANGHTRDYETDYDDDGNMSNLENLNKIYWNYRNNISSVDIVPREKENSDSDFYVYDGSGQRIRKISERKISGSLIEVEEKLYLGVFELKRIKRLADESAAIILERQSLRLTDDSKCIAISYYWLKDDYKRETDVTEVRKNRFQLNNNIGSSCLEVDEYANIITYEEYFPYGGTSLIAGNNEKEVSIKVYRYSGKERDDSTGLYYYGARYYIPWLGRWINTDPSGTVDGLNLYTFVKGNPVSFLDMKGQMGVQFQDEGGDHPIKTMIPEAVEFNHGLINNALAKLQNPNGDVRNILNGWLGRDLNNNDYHEALETLSQKVGTLAGHYNQGRNQSEASEECGCCCGLWSIIKSFFADPEKDELFHISTEKVENSALMSVSPIAKLFITVHTQTWDTVIGNVRGNPTQNEELKLYVSHTIIHEQFHKYLNAQDYGYIDRQDQHSRVEYRPAGRIRNKEMTSLEDHLNNADTLAGIVTQLGMNDTEKYNSYRVQLNNNFSKTLGQVLLDTLQDTFYTISDTVSLLGNNVKKYLW